MHAPPEGPMHLLPSGLALTACSPELITLDTHVYEPLTGDDLEAVALCDWPEAEPCFVAVCAPDA